METAVQPYSGKFLKLLMEEEALLIFKPITTYSLHISLNVSQGISSGANKVYFLGVLNGLLRSVTYFSHKPTIFPFYFH